LLDVSGSRMYIANEIMIKHSKQMRELKKDVTERKIEKCTVAEQINQSMFHCSTV